MSFAFSETFAHVNYMVRSGGVRWDDAISGVCRVVVA
jgi:hypothetical protein